MGMVAYFKVLNPEEFQALREDPDIVEDLLFPMDDDTDPFEGQLCLEKEWQALHFILSGALEPNEKVESLAILGGAEIGPDLGYGPARLIEPDMAKQISEALLKLDLDRCIEAADESSPAAAEIYTGFHKEPNVVGFWKELLRQLENMYGSAAKNGQAVLAYLA